MRLRRVQEEVGSERVSLRVKAYPLRPLEEPGRRVTPRGMQGRMRAGAEALSDGLSFMPWPEDKPLPVSSMPALEAAKAALAQGEDALHRYDLALFRAYFERCLDISDREVLVSLAREEGLDATHLTCELENGRHHRAVAAEFLECLERYGAWATGIPLAVFNSGPPVVGAAPLEVFRTAILRHLNPLSA